MKVQTVLHPLYPPGVDEELERLDGIELIRPRDSDGVYEALADGAPILATFTWEDRYLQPGLRWIAGEGAGFEQYPLDAFADRGIVLTTATGVHSVSVAEHAYGLLLALTRRIAEAVRDSVSHRWRERPGVDLAGRTMGILGLGTIGEAVARRAQRWEIELLGCKRRPERYDGCVPEVLGPDSLLEFCERSDILMITLPGSAETRHLIGDAELEALGEAWLVNVGRGSVIDESALVRHLSEGRLLGAGLDVFEREPLPTDSPLWDMTNVVITPHTAGDTPLYGARWIKIFEENLDAFHSRGQWVNRVVDGERRDRS